MTTADNERVFPSTDWEVRSPEALGFDTLRLERARHLVEGAGSSPYRVVVVRGGYLVAEWMAGIDADSRMGQASASKSYFSCLLGIAVAEGVIPSADARVVDVYPEMMDVGQGEGPKPGRQYPT